MGALVVRLVVRDPSGTRLLARPVGLAGWRLPTLAVAAAAIDDAQAIATAASSALGVHCDVVAAIPDATPPAWEVRPTGRLPAAGNHWIDLAGVGRLGSDAAVAREVLGSARPGGDGEG